MRRNMTVSLEVLLDDKEDLDVFDRGYVYYKPFNSFTDDGLFSSYSLRI